MPGMLAEWEVEDLVAQIHAAQRDRAQAEADREADEQYGAAVLERARAQKLVNDAHDRVLVAAAKYDERARLAGETEARLRMRLEEEWPGVVKTIGLATMMTRRTVALAKIAPADAFRRLDQILGATGALPQIVTGLKIDAKAALPLVDAMPALREVLVVEESRTLSIRQPKEVV